jgi:uncharacterized membrane protein
MIKEYSKDISRFLILLVGVVLVLEIIAAVYLYSHLVKWESIPKVSYQSFLGLYKSIFFILNSGIAILCFSAGLLLSRK